MSDYEVGYGKPPRSTRFKKNQSGNPGGRSGKQLVDALGILQTPVVVPMANGRKRRVDPFELGFERLARKAMKGEFAALNGFLDACWAAGLLVSETVVDRHEFIVIIPQEWDPAAWKACFKLLGPPPWDLPLDGLVPAGRLSRSASGAEGTL